MAKRGQALGNRAVMENTGGLVQADDTPERRLQRQLQLFCTPPWAARAVGEIIRRDDPVKIGRITVWDPGCGLGHIVGPLANMGFDVRGSDIHSWLPETVVHDFLLDAPLLPRPDWIVANPPFTLGQRFAELGLECARVGVALLCRLSFLESIERWPLMRRLEALCPFSERVPMVLGRWDPSASSATAYAWFIWRRRSALGRLDVIPPGTRARLSKPLDAQVYGGLSPAPLIDMGTTSALAETTAC